MRSSQELEQDRMEEAENNAEQEKQKMEMIVKKYGRVNNVVKKNGFLTIGVCIGYKKKASQLGTRREYFQSIINYLEGLQNAKDLNPDGFNNFKICLFGNKFDKGEVHNHLSEISDLLKYDVLKGRVFMMGGYQHEDITLSDYAMKDEANWKDAHAKFIELRKTDPMINVLLREDMNEYLKSNPLIPEEEALQTLIDEVIFYISIGFKEGFGYKPNMLLSADNQPLKTMEYVASPPVAKLLKREPKCVVHEPFSVGVPEPKVVKVKNKKSANNDKDYDNDNDYDSSGSDSDREHDLLQSVALSYAKDTSVPLERAAGLLALIIKDLAGGKKSPDPQHNASSPPKANGSTMSMMAALQSGQNKKSSRSPRQSPDDSPSPKRHENDIRETTGITPPSFSNVAFIATANNNAPTRSVASSDSQDDAELQQGIVARA